MKVVILAGGLGMRLKEETEYRPKPMVPIGGKPILWHIMKIYLYYGFDDFIICLGYKGDIIKHYFINYELINNDFSLDIGKDKKLSVYTNEKSDSFRVTLIDTGSESMTGSRVKQVENYIDDDIFMLTYGDGIAKINIKELLDFHISHKKIGTLTGVFPESRFGELQIEENKIIKFTEKPQMSSGYINGGFFVFNRKFFDYLSLDKNCVLEKDPLSKLADDGELMVYKLNDFWQCMDNIRDMNYLNNLWDTGNPIWKIWD